MLFVAERIVLPRITLQEKYDWRVCTAEVAVFCAMIYIFAQEKGYFSKLISLKPFQWFADISFEVYLLHQPLKYMLVKLFGASLLMGIIAIVMSVVLAVLWKQGTKRLSNKRKEKKESKEASIHNEG